MAALCPWERSILCYCSPPALPWLRRPLTPFCYAVLHRYANPPVTSLFLLRLQSTVPNLARSPLLDRPTLAWSPSFLWLDDYEKVSCLSCMHNSLMTVHTIQWEWPSTVLSLATLLTASTLFQATACRLRTQASRLRPHTGWCLSFSHLSHKSRAVTQLLQILRQMLSSNKAAFVLI